jgi:hypothetical protein
VEGGELVGAEAAEGAEGTVPEGAVPDGQEGPAGVEEAVRVEEAAELAVAHLPKPPIGWRRRSERPLPNPAPDRWTRVRRQPGHRPFRFRPCWA